MNGVGLAGLDRRKMLDAGMVGLAGDVRGPYMADVSGLSGLSQKVNIEQSLLAVPDLKERDSQLARLTRSSRLGDRAAKAWAKGMWFASFEYVVSPFVSGQPRGVVSWRNDRDKYFHRSRRLLPVLLDSAGYRREISGTAPKWTHEREHYYAGIELIDPDGFAAFDYPGDKFKSLQALAEIEQLYPDGRLWPVWSIRWSWSESAHLDYGQLPGWRTQELANLIPLNKTQLRLKWDTREKYARVALANALVTAADPDFKRMADRHGKVMIGGMIQSPCPRVARHLYAAALAHLYPGVQLWLLGQANFAVINGLGMLGLLDSISTDGSWWIKDATAERFAVLDDGLITMHHINGDGSPYQVQSFFTMPEMMAANIRSLLAAYNGEWTWPKPELLPLDLLDPDQRTEMKTRLTANQLELGL